MGKGPWRSEWLTQIAVAVGYVLIYVTIHPISDAHWALRSGLRFSCLLLFPFRYWPALLVGEALPNAVEVLPCLDAYGPTFVAIRCVPPMLVSMPIVWWCRSRWTLFPAQRLIDIKVLMQCALMVTSAWATYGYLAISFVHADAFHAKPIMAVGYFIGNYIAILGTVPMVLMARLDADSKGVMSQLRRITLSRLTTDVVVFAIPVMALLSFVSLRGDEDMGQIARTSMFLPVAWLTLKHGWRAAAVGGALAIAGTCLLTASRPDPRILETQAFIALAITCLLATGARISAQLRLDALKRRNEISVQRLARRNFQMNEQRRRQTSTALEYVAASLFVTSNRLLQQMRRVLPTPETDVYYRQILATQQQVYALAESLHPVAWRERGLPAALNETIARALDEAGLGYRCAISGRGFIRMSPTTLSAIYRSACEAVVLVTARLTCSRVNVVVRGGEAHDRRWLFLQVEGWHDADRMASAVVRAHERQRIATKLGASALDLDQLREHVRTFDGTLHERSDGRHHRITMLLYDVPPHDAEDVQKSAEPLRLWVR